MDDNYMDFTEYTLKSILGGLTEEKTEEKSKEGQCVDSDAFT